MSQATIEPESAARSRSPRRADVWRAVAVCGFLVVAVLVVYSRTLSQGFLNYDDSAYVYDERHVSGGLSWSAIGWAFTSGPAGDWCPLAMLSHMLDCQLYGLRPAGHHLTNVLLHAASSVMLFLVLWRMTAGLWPSALVAALFALHPLRVESVAWIAERRDVLSGLFFMLTLAAYGEYVRHPRSLGRYLAVVGLLALGLLAKSILVTLPALLLLLDFWPLGRLAGAGKGAAVTAAEPRFPWRLIVEKLPLFAVALAAAGVTMHNHNKGTIPLTVPERLANAAVSCTAYLGQLFVPLGLSSFYAHPEAGWPAWQVAAAAVLLLLITAAAVIYCRACPYFFVGWLWYLGMLVPVLEVVPIGTHARADRYTYLSQIGLYIALVWGAMRLGALWPARRWVFGIVSALLLAALTACTWRQTGFWRDSETLWQHAVACDVRNVMAHYLLGTALWDRDEPGASEQFHKALEMGPRSRRIYRPVWAASHNRLGLLAAARGDIAGAMAHYQQALEADPTLAAAHMNLGDMLAGQGDYDLAIAHLERAAELNPTVAGATYRNIAAIRLRQGKVDTAVAVIRKALANEPDSSLAHAHVGTLLAQYGEVDEAIVHFRRAIEIDPHAVSLYQQIAQLLRQRGKFGEAVEFDERGKQARLRYASAQNRHGRELLLQGKLDEAIARFQAAIAAAPNYAEAHCNLADALASRGQPREAIDHYRRALEIDPADARAKGGLEGLTDLETGPASGRR